MDSQVEGGTLPSMIELSVSMVYVAVAVFHCPFWSAATHVCNRIKNRSVVWRAAMADTSVYESSYLYLKFFFFSPFVPLDAKPDWSV